MITHEMVEAAARSDASIDGRKWIAMPRSERERYMARSRAALEAALAIVKAEPVAWEHVMLDETGEELRSRVTYAEGHPFGRPGVDFSEEFKITTTPLYGRPVPAIPLDRRIVPEEPTP